MAITQPGQEAAESHHPPDSVAPQPAGRSEPRRAAPPWPQLLSEQRMGAAAPASAGRLLSGGTALSLSPPKEHLQGLGGWALEMPCNSGGCNIMVFYRRYPHQELPITLPPSPSVGCSLGSYPEPKKVQALHAGTAGTE